VRWKTSTTEVGGSDGRLRRKRRLPATMRLRMKLASTGRQREKGGAPGRDECLQRQQMLELIVADTSHVVAAGGVSGVSLVCPAGSAALSGLRQINRPSR
jgi:hypothetical protein